MVIVEEPRAEDIISNNSLYKIVDIIQSLNGLSRPIIEYALSSLSRSIIECKKKKSSEAHPLILLYQVYFFLTQNEEQFQDCPPMPPHGQLGYGYGTIEEVIFSSTQQVVFPSTAMSLIIPSRYYFQQ
ncbi:uncharacterized protein LOC122721677 isoform X2 [Manihot esculenta]|uniref:uncharacterized protein LOC122721677 isoform X2 n=1 Tax=Manihot esculenta TaxID=3983 RepID=UPI001CC4A0F7|nr:uncharacterized protein LOC122721677 isoform X2 [Manihot esculenta]